jgi:hypothetical protein
LFPISEHSFYVAALKKMFMARTKDSTIFREAKNKKGGKMSLEMVNNTATGQSSSK